MCVCVCVCVCGLVAQLYPLFATPWTVALQEPARQAPLSIGFPSQEYWSGLSFPSLRDLPDSGIEPGSPEHLLHHRQVLLALSHWR